MGGHECRYLQSPEKGLEFPEARVAGSSGRPDVDAGNETPILCNSNTSS